MNKYEIEIIKDNMMKQNVPSNILFSQLWCKMEYHLVHWIRLLSRVVKWKMYGNGSI